MADEEQGTPARPGAAAIVLAAGESRRFGSQKLLMPFGDSTVLGCVIAALETAELSPIIVVVGADQAVADWVERSARRARIAHNPDPGRGMLSSVRVGVAALPPEGERFVLALGDQPALEARDIARLLGEHKRLGKGIALPVHRGKRGHPVVFAARYRQEIMALDARPGGEARTLRHLIHAHHEDVAEVDFDSDAVLRDLDTREQYQDELKRSNSAQ